MELSFHALACFSDAYKLWLCLRLTAALFADMIAFPEKKILTQPVPPVGNEA